MHAHAQNEPIKNYYCRSNHAARVNVSRNAFFTFSASALKENIVVCTLIDNEYASLLFSQTFFSHFFLYVEQFLKSFWKKSLTRTSSSFA